MNKARMKATTSIMNSNHIPLLFFVSCLQIVIVMSSCLVGQIRHGNKCCKPVFHCPAGHFVKTCERNGNCDECIACPPKFQNPFITSSFDVKKCYKNSCSTDSFPVSENKCKCSLHRGYSGSDSRFCQINHVHCLAGEELTDRGKCENCENNHYKYWEGFGYCIKDIDCSKLGLAQDTGNLKTPSTCNGFIDTCPSIARDPPLPSNPRPPTSLKVMVSSSRTTKPSVPVMTTVTRKTTTKTTTKRPLTKRKVESKTITTVPPPIAETSEFVTSIYGKTPDETVKSDTLRLFKVTYIYITVICLLIVIIIMQATYIVRTKYKDNKKRKKHDNNYQQIDYLRKVSPNDIQRPLPKKPSANNLIDTYMEMGRSGSTIKKSVPYIISSPYDPSTLTRLIQQPGGAIPLFQPVYQQNPQAMANFHHCSPPRQESNASGEEEFNSLHLGSSPSVYNCSMSSETALKLPDSAEPYRNRLDTATSTVLKVPDPVEPDPNRVQPATVTEAPRVDPVRVEPFTRDLDPTYQDALSIHSPTSYSPPPIQIIHPAQATQMGVVFPQFMQYTQPMNMTRNREYV